jgi:hypothetical protein
MPHVKCQSVGAAPLRQARETAAPDRPGLVVAVVDGKEVPRFDARRAWAQLSPEAQRAIGEAALLAAYCVLAIQHVAGRGAITFEAGAYHGYRMLSRAAGEVLAPIAEPVPRPDLAVFGIRACRRCGCTEAVGCPGGCSWVAADLCSGCAR